MNSIHSLQRKMKEWKSIQSSQWNEMKGLISALETSQSLNIVSFFTYSLNITHAQGYDNYCLGSYHIRNIGTKPLTNPYICIKISDDSILEFSGKYLYRNSQQSIRVANAWERLNESTDKQEFWLRPTHTQVLNPSETLTFPNFQIKWNPEDTYSESIQGFTYGDELSNGQNSLNTIHINGSIQLREGEEDE